MLRTAWGCREGLFGLAQNKRDDRSNVDIPFGFWWLFPDSNRGPADYDRSQKVGFYSFPLAGKWEGYPCKANVLSVATGWLLGLSTAACPCGQVFAPFLRCAKKNLSTKGRGSGWVSLSALHENLTMKNPFTPPSQSDIEGRYMMRIADLLSDDPFLLAVLGGTFKVAAEYDKKQRYVRYTFTPVSDKEKRLAKKA
ncbi:MAG: hypothetical protein ACH34Y_08615 [Brachymonas sp.]